MTDIIQAGIEIDVTGVDRGEVALKRLAQTGEQVDKSFGRGAKAAKEAGDATEQAGKAADRARGSFGDFAQETREMATATNGLASAAYKLGAALGSAFAFSKTISTVTAFENSILRLQATSGAATDAMAQLEKQARTLGAASSYSAKQAADAQNFLAMAGLKTNEILSSTASVMKFATAAGIDLARSADIASNVLGGMQMPVEQLDRVMNAMVNSAQSANTNIDQLGEAFSYAAPLAVTAGVSVEQLAAAVGVLGDAGVQGGRAGTSMVGIIRQLASATPEAQKSLASYGLTMADVDIKSKGLTEVLKTLQVANLSTADAMKIFGTRAASAALILAGGVDKVEDLTKANEQAAGKLDEVSGIIGSSLSTAFAAVSSAIEEMMLQTGDAGLTGTLKTLAITTAGVIGSFNGMLPEFAAANGLSKEFTRNIELASIALKGIGATVGIWALVRGAIFGATQAQLAFNLAARANPYVLIATAIVSAAVVLHQFVTAQDRAAIETKRLWDDAVGSAAAYQVAVGNLTNTQNILNNLHHKELKLQEEMQAMRDKGFKQYGWHADQYRKKEEEFLAIQQQRKELLDSKVAADKAAGERQIEANKRQEEANALQAKMAEIQAEMERQMADGIATTGEAGEALKALDAERKRALAAQLQSAEAIAKGNEELRVEIEQTGKVGAELVELERRRNSAAMAALKEKAASLELTKGREKEVAAIRDQIKELAERNRLIGISYAVKAVDDIRKRNDALREEIREIGKSRRELVALEQQRNAQAVAALKEKAATLELIAGREEEVAAIREQIDALHERNRLLGERIDTEEVYESQKKIADQWQSLSDDMGRTFTDAIIQGGVNAKEAIKRMFTNMVLRPIVEPIAQGVANMFTGAISGMFGGGQGSGLGGMLGGMFGGGDSGGGGGGSFGFGSMLQTGQSIYSAATGWGKAMFTGFSEGGFTGAMQGLGSYFGGITAKIGSWFGGGAASGAAGGVGFGIGQPLVSGGVGSASYAGGSGMFSGLASAWPLAVVMGMIQSGKLYDAGVRPDASEMWKSTQGNIFGRMGNVAATFQSGKFKLIDSVLEPIVGGKIAAMLSGSTFHQALWGGINKKLFGSGERFKRTVGSATGYYGDDGYVSTGPSATWHPGSRKFGAEHDAALDSLNNAFITTVGSLFEAFDVDSAIASTTRTRLRRTSGRMVGDFITEIDGQITNHFRQYSKDGKLGEAMEQFSDDIMGEYLAKTIVGSDLPEHFRQQFEPLAADRKVTAEQVSETLTDIFNRFDGVNAILETTGHAAYELTNAGMILSDQLLDIAGGLENLAGASDVYYKNFFTAEEQFEHSFAAMTKALEDAELGAIGSREAYREVVEGLDLTTEAGQEMFATMMGLAGIASDYFSILEDQAAKAGIISESLRAVGISAEASAKDLLGVSGGFDALMSGINAYYQGFFTEAEMFEKSLSEIRDTLADAGLGAISSREAYRQAVEGLDLTTEAGQEMFATMMAMAGTASEYFSILEGYQNTLAGMSVALNAEPVLGYSATLLALQNDLEGMTKELEAVGLATDENLDTLEQFRQKMAEMAALDLFGGGQSMADALRQGLMGTWDGEAIGDYLARSISDGVYGAIAGQFANQITDILLQGIVAPMINAAMTGASISAAVSSSTISAMVAQAQAVAEVAAEVMGALKESGVMDELQKALGGGFTLPKANYTAPAYRPPVTPSRSAQKVDDSWKRLLESIINQTERAQQQIADMGRTTYEKGLAAIASTVADYQAQIAQSTASKRKQLTDELVLMEQAERRLLEAQMDQRAADMLAGLADELARIGKTDAELAIMSIEKQTQDYIKSLHDVGRATADNIAQVEAWSQAMKDAAAKDAQIRAASDAYDALGRAAESQRSVITEALELARDVAESAASAAKDLFSNVLGASDASAAQARAFIGDALSTARSTGYLPDGDKLREAIDSATRGLDDAAAVSIADANWQKLVLANQLKELADLAEPQVDYAQSQLDALDNMLENARDQLDVLQGIDNSVLTVAEALSRFNEVVGNGQIITPDSPVFTPDMPPQSAAPDNRAQEANAELVAEVIELRNYMREIQRETKRTADAVNGRGDAPMLVETV